MKILKQENIDNWEYKHTCRECCSELLVERNDLKYHSGNYDPRDGTAYGEGFFTKCPICKQEFQIPSNVVPKLLQIQIKQNQKDYLDNHSR